MSIKQTEEEKKMDMIFDIDGQGGLGPRLRYVMDSRVAVFSLEEASIVLPYASYLRVLAVREDTMECQWVIDMVQTQEFFSHAVD